VFSSIDLKRWVNENSHLFRPPHRTNHVLAHNDDFIVMVLHGPNMRLDFHIEPGEEFFYQIKGDIEIHLKPDGQRRQVVAVREGEMFLCPGGLAHSPRRAQQTWGLVIERRRKPDEMEEFAWFCESCDEKVLSRIVRQTDVAAQVSKIYAEFNSSLALRTCRRCGYRFPETAMAERLGFLEPR
jgi:3-hydroxyanthranilate 3,4-dioxygenase